MCVSSKECARPIHKSGDRPQDPQGSTWEVLNLGNRDQPPPEESSKQEWILEAGA